MKALTLFLATFVLLLASGCDHNPQPKAKSPKTLVVRNSINGRYLIRVNNEPIHSGVLSAWIAADFLQRGKNTISYEFDLVPPPNDLHSMSILHEGKSLVMIEANSKDLKEGWGDEVTLKVPSKKAANSALLPFEMTDEVSLRIEQLLNAYSTFDIDALAELSKVPAEKIYEEFKHELRWDRRSLDVSIAGNDDIEYIIGERAVLARVSAEAVKRRPHHYLVQIKEPKTGAAIFVESLTLVKGEEGLMLLSPR